MQDEYSFYIFFLNFSIGLEILFMHHARMNLTLCFDIDFIIQRDLQTLFIVTELH